MGKPTCYILSGVPGSGKSTWARNLQSKMPKFFEHISRDEIRFSLLKEGEKYFAHENEVLSIFYKRANEALAAGKNVILDSTHVSEKSLNETLRRILVDCDKMLVSFETPLDVCISRNAKRDGRTRVPEPVIHNMWNNKEHLQQSINNGQITISVWSIGEDN